MPFRRDQIDEYHAQAAQMESDADELETGRRSIGSIFGNRRVDESNDVATDKRRRAGVLRRIIAALGGSDD